MFNKKGIVEAGVTVTAAIIAAVVAISGSLFTGGNPIGSSMFVVGTAATIYTQSDHVKRDFREKKAVREFGITETAAEALSDDALLDLIRDDAPGYMSRATLMKANPNLYLGG